MPNPEILEHPIIHSRKNKSRSWWRYALAGVIGLAGSGAAVVYDATLDLKPPKTAAQSITLPDSFPTSSQALNEFLSSKKLNPYDPCRDYEEKYGNIFGPEEDRTCREKDPLKIWTTNDVVNNTGDVAEQRSVINLNQLWTSRRDEITRGFFDSKFVSSIPMEYTFSMASALDGKTILVGGAGLCISYDSGKTWENINQSRLVVDLVRLTDTHYLGSDISDLGSNIGEQFILKIDQNTKKVTIQPVIPSMNAYQFRVASLDTTSNRTKLVTTNFPNNGIGIMDIDYERGLGTVENITQTLVGDTLVDLNDLRGIGLYTVDGNMHIKTSDNNQFLYDINPATGTATRRYYADIFNDHGIPNYVNGSPKITTVDVLTDTLVGGYYTSSIDGKSRAFFGNLETTAFYDLSPNRESYIWVQPEGMQRLQFNSQMAYKLVGWPFGQVVVPDGGAPIYINSGLGQFKIFLPLGLKN